MKYSVIGTVEAQAWRESLTRFQTTDIYFLPEYHRVHELNGEGRAQAFVFQSGEHLLFYPFLVRPIDSVRQPDDSLVWYDIETVYGYSGPLSTTMDMSFLTEAWQAFENWCNDNHIVAEFIRFNPFAGNHRYVTDSSAITLDRETVAIRLGYSETELWKKYPSGHRTKIRKAIKDGLVCRETPFGENIELFQRIYEGTMSYVGATSYYLFPKAFFCSVRDLVGDRTKLFIVLDKGKAVAAAMFFVFGDKMHYHLGGSDADLRGSRPNNLLFHAVATWANENGLAWLHLGGGRTSDPSDSLFAFKSSVSRDRLPFYVGKRIHNREIYDSLCAEWLSRNKVSERPNYFLLYRL
ncbi:MAG: FemAB family protein [Syntrophorhabdus sp. PtaU1.Bin002]|nr:MAG: FemAB family protein [Syntrophorhabdus sp. PtaB.Bin006]OPY73563.1 MAG: FemAB family protein [Syntrophorhabdus sp. PtaU1.Bin002]